MNKLLLNMTDPKLISFVAEALNCFEHKNYRAAVVFSWVGAIWLLYKHVLGFHLTEFNAEAARRDLKWKPVKSIDDFGRMKEKEFLDVLAAISIIGKNVKQELEHCLIFRNGCGHPNSLSIGENKVAAHLEMLILNVYTKFGL